MAAAFLEIARMIRGSPRCGSSADRSPVFAPIPDARELFRHMTRAGGPWAIAISRRLESARPKLVGASLAGQLLSRIGIRGLSKIGARGDVRVC
jgi:hypothetical protein